MRAGGRREIGYILGPFLSILFSSCSISCSSWVSARSGPSLIFPAPSLSTTIAASFPVAMSYFSPPFIFFLPATLFSPVSGEPDVVGDESGIKGEAGREGIALVFLAALSTSMSFCVMAPSAPSALSMA